VELKPEVLQHHSDTYLDHVASHWCRAIMKDVESDIKLGRTERIVYVVSIPGFGTYAWPPGILPRVVTLCLQKLQAQHLASDLVSFPDTGVCYTLIRVRWNVGCALHQRWHQAVESAFDQHEETLWNRINTQIAGCSGLGRSYYTFNVALYINDELHCRWTMHPGRARAWVAKTLQKLRAGGCEVSVYQPSGQPLPLACHVKWQ
jgi:hypothetical protein